MIKIKEKLNKRELLFILLIKRTKSMIIDLALNFIALVLGKINCYHLSSISHFIEE